jgi:hypothetical protein
MELTQQELQASKLSKASFEEHGWLDKCNRGPFLCDSEQMIKSLKISQKQRCVFCG